STLSAGVNIVVIADSTGEPIAARVEELAAGEDGLTVVRAEPFRCRDLTDSSFGQTCGNWLERWPALIEDHDPDAVLFLVDGGAGSDLRGLVELPDDRLPTVLREALDVGFDLLTARGAPVVWGTSPAYGPRAELPVHVAMNELVRRREDVRATRALPPPPPTIDESYLSEAAE